ncbi:aromatic amino acid aminotransferase [Plectosphaerella plurivora]|uniref:aromatic-amino-acid transaminase n=1 Tax=Plectosphaerella plurivora TaxID=936078 RepID=A0A9P9AAA9_9PEZI|nr:aromatic amino acid aminotransferase [Plectosphaerella plurivora]
MLLTAHVVRQPLRLRPLAAFGTANTTPIPRRPFHSKSAVQSTAEAAPQQQDATFEKQPSISPFDAIKDRRAKAGRLLAGVAAASDADMFKAPSFGKPKAKDWDQHFTLEARHREPCTLKQAARYLKNPGLISLGGGLPSSEAFPIAEISMRVPEAPNFSESDYLSTGRTVTIGKYDVRDGKSEYDLSVALNYGQATGSAQMMRFITEHTELVYNPPYADWQVCQTIGSTGALEQALRMLCDGTRKDSILTEEYSFSTALETITPLGVKPIGVPIDDQGLLPDEMDAILTHWDPTARGGVRKPHVLYTVPSGQNPTGATQGSDRRREIYAVCQKHDIFIIEDEPYYFIQMEPYTSGAPASSPDPTNPQSVEDFLTSLIPSLLSLDVDGRVLRMDSFSKVLVPGSRLGWITASAQVVERYVRHAEVASQGPSGISQVVLWKLIDQTWGHEGYLRWLMDLRLNYTRRRNMLLAACEKHLPLEVVSWAPPIAGMFLWLKVDHTKHPDYSSRTIIDLEDEIFHQAIENGVLCSRGSWFRTEPDVPANSIFFRATFASASEEAMSTAIERLGAAIRKSYRM